MRNYGISECGRSMIEMLGVLAIVGVLSVAGIAGYSKGMTKYKANKLLDQASTIVANVRTTFANEGGYAGLDTILAKKLKILPEEMTRNCNSHYCMKHAFNDTTTVGSMGSGFRLYLESIPSEACEVLAMADWEGLERMKTTKMVGNGSQAGSTVSANSLSLSTIAEACGASDIISIELLFK